MAFPQSLLNDATAALEGLSVAARREFLQLWSQSVGASDVIGLVEEWFPPLVEKYGSVAGTLGSEVFAAQAEALGVTPRLDVAATDWDEAARRGRWAATTPNPEGNFKVLLDELVKVPFRVTVERSAWASGGAFARVPTRPEPCAFCVMLASRGAVYHTSATAGGERPYHGDCGCIPVFVRGPQDYPAGYDPDRYLNMYDAAVAEAGGGTRNVLAAMRAQQGIR